MCNLSCAHCCVPKTSDQQLPLDLALTCIREAAGLRITAVGFTGGEPMLVFEWVAEAVREAVRVGLEADDLSTNGVWWSHRDELEMRLRVLKVAGFAGGFHLSVDAFHAGAGGERQAEFIRAAIEIFGTAGSLSCAESPNHSAMPVIVELARHLDAEVTEESAETGHLDVGGVTVRYFRFPVAEVGQRAHVGVSTGAEWFGDFDCFGHDSVYVDPEGKARFCLGFATYAAPALCLGDVAQEGLAAVMSSAAADPLVELLCAEGPRGLRRVIEEGDPDAFLEPWSSPCSFCYHCLTDKRRVSVLREAGLVG
jgi:hypothetical protein